MRHRSLFSKYTHFFRTLVFEKKIIIISSLIGYLSLLLPWQNIGDMSHSGFHGIIFFINILQLLLITMTCTVVLFADQVKKMAHRYVWNIKTSRLLMFFGWQGILLVCIAFFVLLAASQISSLITIRFGIFIHLFCHMGILIGGYLLRSHEMTGKTYYENIDKDDEKAHHKHDQNNMF
jgi:hypothetical protein